MLKPIPLSVAMCCTLAASALFLAGGGGEGEGTSLQAAAASVSRSSAAAQWPEVARSAKTVEPAAQAGAERAPALQDPFQSGRFWSSGAGPAHGLPASGREPLYADPLSDTFQEAARLVRAAEQETVIEPPLQLTQPAPLHANPDSF